MDEVHQLESRTIVSFIYPQQNPDLIQQFQTQKSTVFAMDCLLRTLSRGQTYDALSSQANISGYRAILEACQVYPSFLAGQMTAAGKISPARVLVLGTGVAGLAAIQTAKNMGAIVSAFDVRAVTAEQVAAMGATFLKVPSTEDGSGTGGYAKEMSPEWHAAARQMLSQTLINTDIVITTALIPGRRAPVMITKEMIQLMKPGSVTVDLAAEAGGNIETTVRDEMIVTDNGVTCIGYTDLPSRLSTTSSTLYANNISKFVLSIGPYSTKINDHYYIDPDHDDAVRSMLIVHNGTLLYPPKQSPPVVATTTSSKEEEKKKEVKKEELVVDHRKPYMTGAQNVTIASSSLLALGMIAPDPAFASLITIFALSNIIGVQTVLGVTHALHSPLMAVTNAST
jgi:NAD(P) transhydrogenase